MFWDFVLPLKAEPEHALHLVLQALYILEAFELHLLIMYLQKGMEGISSFE